MGKRKANYPIDTIFINRWSPRAISKEMLPKKELFSLFEAARWAPSSYNGQPWRFIYAQKGTAEWNAFFDLLVPFNQEWAKNATYLVTIVSRNNFEYNDTFSRTHSFDTGSAWQNLALQASTMGIVAHAMEGFDYDKAYKIMNIPDDYTVEAMIAIGKYGNKKELSEDLQRNEIQNNRKKVKEFVYEGQFKEKK